MNNDLLTIYCLCYERNIPRKTQFNQKTLICGSAYLDLRARDQLTRNGFLLDSSGQNISWLNCMFGDLTGTYWVWKNAQEEFIGTSHYRQFWIEDEVNSLQLNDYSFYVIKTADWNEHAIDQYVYSHGSHGLELLSRAIYNVPNFKLDFESIDKLYNINYINPAHMFFCHRNLYDKFCTVLFDILFDLYRISFEEICHLYDHHPEARRTLAFLSERIFTVLMINAEKYFGNVEVVHMTREILGDKTNI